MSKAFDTKNIHTLIRKLLQTNIPGTIIKFIANYIKGYKAYTTYRNHTSKQRQFKTGVPEDGILSPTPFNIYTPDLPPPSTLVQVMACADDITITSTHTQARVQPRNIYNHTYINNTTEIYTSSCRILQKYTRARKSECWEMKAEELQRAADMNDMKGFYSGLREVWGL